MALSLSRNQLLLVMFFFASTMTVLVLSEEDEEEGDDFPQPEPKVSGPGSRITVYEGQDFKLNCGITDIGHLDINWKFNDIIITMGEHGLGTWAGRARAKNLTLEITQARLSDTGLYHCAVFINDDAIQQEHYVDVVKVPSVMIEPKSPIEIEAGGTLKLTCKFEHDPNAIKEIRWEFQDRPVKQEVKSPHILQIKSVTADKSGKYKCVVKFSEDKMHEATAMVTVLELPKLTSETESINAKIGDDQTLHCDHTGPKPRTITWYFNGQPYHEGNGLNEIMLKNLQQSQFGEYKCILNNNDKLSKTIMLLSNQFAPKTWPNKNWVHAGETRTIEISCTIESNPPAIMYWLYNNTHIQNGVRTNANKQKITNKSIKLEGNKFVLNIRNFRIDDFGIYTCWANNSIGWGFSTINVSGLATPIELSVTKMFNREAKISYSTNSYSKVLLFMLKYRNLSQLDQWHEINIPAEKSTSFVYHNVFNFRDLEPSTEYEVVMQAENLYGWNDPSNILQFSLPTSDGTEKDDITSSTFEIESSEEEIEASTVTSSIQHLPVISELVITYSLISL